MATATTTYDMDTVRQKLKSGELTAKTREDGVSGVWDKFLLVVDGSERSVGFVKCGSCEVIYKYNAQRTGTSNMVRHQCGRTRRGRKNKRDAAQYDSDPAWAPDNICAPLSPRLAGELADAETKDPSKRARKPLCMEDDISLYTLHLERKMRKVRDPGVLLELQHQIDQACFQALMSQIPNNQMMPGSRVHSGQVPGGGGQMSGQLQQIDTQNPMNHQVGNSFQYKQNQD